MARPRTYHQDRALTQAERAKAYRERKKSAEKADRHETTVTKRPSRNGVTKPPSRNGVTKRPGEAGGSSPRVASPSKTRTETKATLWIGAEAEKFLQLVNAQLKASGQSDEPKALIKAIEDCRPRLPEKYRKLSTETLRVGWYKASTARHDLELALLRLDASAKQASDMISRLQLSTGPRDDAGTIIADIAKLNCSKHDK